MSTLANILEKKQSGKIKVKEQDIFKSKILGEDIVVKKKPLSEFMAIFNESHEEENEIMMMNYLIHAFCPMFEDPDAVKASMEYYGAVTPRELPELVFEGNMEEMEGILNIIMSFYDMEAMSDDIKN